MKRIFLTASFIAFAVPAGAAPVAIAVGVAAAAGGAGVALGVTTLGAAFVGVAATAVAATASYLTAPKPASASYTASGLSTGVSTGSGRQLGAPISAPASPNVNVARSLTVRQPLPPRRFVYGDCRVSGPVFFQDVSNPYLFMGVLLSDGPIEAVNTLFIGEDEVPLDGSNEATAGTRFSGLVKLEFGDGSEDQAVSTLLNGTFPTVAGANYRQRGVARVVLRLEWGANSENHNFVWGQGFEPVFQVQGALVGDPRTETLTKGDPSNYAFSDNPALCVLHACVNAWSSELDYSDFDLDTVGDAADDCDTLIDTPAGQQKIFTLAGVFQSDAPIATQVADMLGSFGGVITFADGKYEIHADKDRASVYTFTDDDFLGLESYQFAPDPSDIFEAIKGVYFDAASSGRRATTPIYEVEGASAPRDTSIELPFTPNDYSAQVLAYRALMEGRNGGEAVFRMRDSAMWLRPSEVFTMNSAGLPSINGEYKCVQVDLTDIGCIVVAKKKVADAYVDPIEYLQ